VLHRKIDNGYEVVQAKLPCLITVEKDINELSFAPLTNMIKAARYNPITWGINDLGGDLSKLGLKGSPTSVRRIFPPEQRAGGELLKGSEDEVVKTLVDKLKGGIRKCQI